ncbi:MAG: type III polyketide synthase [Gammaproteobacteria bacterium]|nr:type III polyketide synthase [Gammaproteobacteria bacterium]
MSTILGIGTAVPNFKMQQDYLASFMAKALKLNAAHAAKFEKVGVNTVIEERYSVLGDFLEEVEQDKVFLGANFPDSQPSLQLRNQRYQQEALPLAYRAARLACQSWGGDYQAITHVVVVSCTGIMMPGLDAHLVDQLSLNPKVERIGVHFMGCFGAFKGLAVASALSRENAKNRILLVCLELCSLHFQDSEHQDTLLANLLFADGCAAVIVGDAANTNAGCKIIKRESYLLPGSRDTMSWDIGPTALEMHMTKETPAKIRSAIKPFVERLLPGKFAEADFIIHPGGKAILHAVEMACQLKKTQTQHSWEILRRYGNMSSPTVLFILKRLLQDPDGQKQFVMLGFGPGLTVEGLLCQRNV